MLLRVCIHEYIKGERGNMSCVCVCRGQHLMSFTVVSMKEKDDKECTITNKEIKRLDSRVFESLFALE